MSELLHITIDGKDCTCEKGEYLWDVAKRNGVFIPVFCRSDAFPDHRACCRVCIVEVEIRGRSKVVTSCVYPVEQECVVRTDSDRIKEERSVVLGLLAARAPEAQRVALLSKINGNDGFERLTVLDGEKCILCGNCQRNCPSSAIKVSKADFTWEIHPFSCVQCSKCVEVCPVKCLSMVNSFTEPGAEKTKIVNRYSEEKIAKEKEKQRLMAEKIAAAKKAAAEKAAAAKAPAQTPAGT